MTELVLQADLLEAFRSELLGRGVEGCVVLLTHQSKASARVRLLVSEVIVPESSDYSFRESDGAELNPHFVARVAKRAISTGTGIVFVHSHPGDLPPRFSRTDDSGEQHLAKFLARRIPYAIHAALVVSSGGYAARELGGTKQVRVTSVGASLRVLADAKTSGHSGASAVHDRQVRAFGLAGQKRIAELVIGIVGLGGTGSIVAQELAHLGAQQFLLIDPDKIEATNLNRVSDAGPEDVGSKKVEVARRYIRKTAPNCVVKTIVGDVTRRSVAESLSGVDFIMSCTDSHGSRAVIQQIAYQYLIPCIDMGTVVATNQGRVTHIHGRVQMLSAGLPCLSCSKLLDGNEVRRDMMTSEEKKTDPYILGGNEPAPAVMSLNATIASLAVTMFLGAVTDIPVSGRHLLYNGLTPALRSISIARDPRCFVCSTYGSLARGDSVPIMARQD